MEKTTLARPYAKAAFAYAEEQQNAKAWSQALWIAAQICLDTQAKQLLEDPRINDEQRFDLFYAVGKTYFNDAQTNFLKLLIENKRTTLLPEISALFDKIRATIESNSSSEGLACPY